MSSEREYYALVQKTFDILAPIYDVMALPLARARHNVVELADLEPGSKVLDIAAGTGQQSFAFAKRGYEVIGVDISQAMLNVARKNNRYENLKFELADATALP